MVSLRTTVAAAYNATGLFSAYIGYNKITKSNDIIDEAIGVAVVIEGIVMIGCSYLTYYDLWDNILS